MQQNEEPSDFGQARQNLITEIEQDLRDVIAEVSTLNRNLESLVEVGHDFERVSDVWSTFHQKIASKA